MTSVLDQDIMYLSGVGPAKREILTSQIGVSTWNDLIEYYPYKYVDRSRFYRIGELSGELPFVQIRARILSFDEYAMAGRRRRVVAHVSDGSGVADLVWFRGVQWVYKSFQVGVEYVIFGRPTVYQGRYQFAHPEMEKAGDATVSGMGLQPFYNTTEKMKLRGLASPQISRLVRTMLQKIPQGAIAETLPDDIRQRLRLVGREEALRLIHGPKTVDDVQRAQVRLKFEELFYVQLNILRYAHETRRKFRGYVFPHVGTAFHTFYRDHLPFELTAAQKRVMHEIRADLLTGRQMNRLLQGDVGSGKTLVALMAMLLAVGNGFQACMMAPTEILAEQHVATLRSLLDGMPVDVELLTGQVRGRRRDDVLARLAEGTTDILVGTHAVIEDGVSFRRLGLAVIDEQHRFGVVQRAKLWKKSERPPHILVMTATPIPRTLAMTIYGDLDVSVIDELPPGRKPVATTHRYDTQLASLYQGLRRQLGAGRQVYVVYPLIEENEKSDLKNLEDGYRHLCDVFPDVRIGKVHGRMKARDKDEEMARFVSGETRILVATTVIEVGVNVPNASVMVVMEAQRFGLSQLHQLRGRVGRGADQSYCVLVTPCKLSAETRKRIDIMCATNDGFRIAEADLKLRGPGDLEGTQQSGMAYDLKIANIARDGQLVQMAREEAQRVVDGDRACDDPRNALLWNRLRELRKTRAGWWAVS